MDYAKFREYRKRLPNDIISLDDLNPYPVIDSLPKENFVDGKNELILSDICVQKSTGVRDLLSILFTHFHEIGSAIHLPEDVYPEYFKLLPPLAVISQYKTCNLCNYSLPHQDNIVSLIANPKTPEGRYLTAFEINQFDAWLSASSTRWLIIDTVYDYFGTAIKQPFNTDRIIFVGSKSKLYLQPKTVGWALCKEPVLDFKREQSFTLSLDIPTFLEDQYRKAWDIIQNQYDLEKPEIGYLSVARIDYRIFLEQYGAAAIPATVFGITDSSLSVVSCLDVVKNEIMKKKNVR